MIIKDIMKEIVFLNIRYSEMFNSECDINKYDDDNNIINNKKIL
jgi:hypothetical protein